MLLRAKSSLFRSSGPCARAVDQFGCFTAAARGTVCSALPAGRQPSEAQESGSAPSNRCGLAGRSARVRSTIANKRAIAASMLRGACSEHELLSNEALARAARHLLLPRPSSCCSPRMPDPGALSDLSRARPSP